MPALLTTLADQANIGERKMLLVSRGENGLKYAPIFAKV